MSVSFTNALVMTYRLFSLAATVAFAACGAARHEQGVDPSCRGISLEALATNPPPLSVRKILWRDDTTLVTFSNGIMIVDIANHEIVRAYRGLGSIVTAAWRKGSRTELLFFDQVDQAGTYTGYTFRAGHVDLATGCAQVTDPLEPGLVAIDPVNDGFIIAPNGPDNADKGHARLVRVDSTTLQPSAQRSVPRLDDLGYDETTNSLITSSYGDDVVRIRDPVTLADRAEVHLTVLVRSGFGIRPKHGQIVMQYENPCTPLTPRTTMHVRCRELTAGERGTSLIALAPPTELSRMPHALGADCDDRRMSWTPDGARGYVPCNGDRDLLEWTPDTKATRYVPRPPLDYWSPMEWSADADTYAAVGVIGNRMTLDVRSISTGALLWQLALAGRP